MQKPFLPLPVGRGGAAAALPVLVATVTSRLGLGGTPTKTCVCAATQQRWTSAGVTARDWNTNDFGDTLPSS